MHAINITMVNRTKLNLGKKACLKYVNSTSDFVLEFYVKKKLQRFVTIIALSF